MAVIGAPYNFLFVSLFTPSWLATKVGSAAAIAFNSYSLWNDRFSPEGIAIVATLELCCLLGLGILSAHQSKYTFNEDAKNYAYIVCFEAAFFTYTLRGIQALFGLNTAFSARPMQGHKKALAAASLLLLVFSVAGLSNLVNQPPFCEKSRPY